jgi:hypothetical protein
VPTEVDVFNYNHAARTNMSADRRDQTFRARKMGQEKPSVNDIEWLAGLPIDHVSNFECSVIKALLVTLPSRNIEQRLITVYPDRFTRRTSCSSKLECHIATATSDVEAFRSGGYADFSKEGTGGWTHDLGQESEPFATARATWDDILLCWH